ncbi:MAG: 50S ribosomal protein L11 [Candidatus Pacebacteria bacterium]|nr:50S ribosomal protein L11 [Candidatus Paceibacterota bacterium]MCD8508370.1 50S ribosomal protein L11 [Candidatus Paceibacterota bacterium]MCD8528384.1 50S ribosomal protein L11 [Candidatus Paceibacterota bacterium]MCD8563682.1 50S ribosomal protein L11 [Candidatus Paceibacterota bacterium]
MAKKIVKTLKLQIKGGQANPAPPLGPALGQAGVNIGEFVNQFNAATSAQMGETVSVLLDVYDDRTFSFVIKTAPASALIKKAAGIKSGSGKNAQKKAGSITTAQLRQIAEEKLPDLNAHDIDAAMKIIEGSARSMGVQIKD